MILFLSLLFRSAALVASASSSNKYRQQLQLLWEDDFASETTTTPNPNYWNLDVGPPGWGNGEFQEYTNHPDNAHVENGKLYITAIRDEVAELGFTSARLTTAQKVRLQYGVLEASIQVPKIELGLWPAFWTLGESFPQVPWPACGEMDIMEIGQQRGVAVEGVGNRRVITAAHYQRNNEEQSYAIEKGIFDAPMDLTDGFHTYRLEWTPFSLRTFVDDTEMWRMDLRECGDDCNEFHQPHFLILNLAIGGGFTCCKYGSEVSDAPIGTKWTMAVDHVRVYANEYTIFHGPETTTAGTEPTTAQAPLENNAATASSSGNEAIHTQEALSTIAPDTDASQSQPQQPTSMEGEVTPPRYENWAEPVTENEKEEGELPMPVSSSSTTTEATVSGPESLVVDLPLFQITSSQAHSLGSVNRWGFFMALPLAVSFIMAILL